MGGSLRLIVILASCGMIASWIHAWSGFLMSCISRPSFGLTAMFLMLLCSVFVTHIHKGKGWRVIWIVVLHLLYLSLSLSWAAYQLSDISFPFWDIAWIGSFMELDRGMAEWTALIFYGILVTALWIFGIRLAGEMDEDTISGRFDIGLAMLIFLLVIKLLIKTKGGIIARPHDAELNILYFFFFGLFAVGLTHYQGSNKSGGTTYYKSTGIIMSFTVAIFILGVLFSTLLLPGLNAGAEISYSLIKTVSRPFLHAFVFIIRILLVSGCRRSIRTDEQKNDMDNEIPFDPSGIEEEGIIMAVFRWSILGIGAVISLFFIFLILYYIYRILSSRTKKGKVGYSLFSYLFYCISTIKALISFLLLKILFKHRMETGPEVFYRLLSRWGTHCGLPPKLSETPAEYGSRLVRFFPNLGNEIDHIIGIHDRSLYGEMDIDTGQLRLAGLAWRSLRSLRIWPARIRTWLNYPGVSDIMETDS